MHLNRSWRAVTKKTDYPPAVRALLGETLAAGVLLSSTLKFQGALTIQAQAAGPVTLLVAQVTSGRALRGLAKWRGEVTSAPLPELLKDGRLAITIEPERGRERYQSIVALEGDDLAAALERYFRQSEQLDTRLWLSAGRDVVAGLLLQEMPRPPAERERDPDPDAWNRMLELAATVTDEELFALPADELLRRLFHQETVRVFDAEPVSFRCRCSRRRVGNMLRGLGRKEVRAIIAEQGGVEVTCDFCNQHYAFDAVDAEALFKPTATASWTRH